MLGFKVFRVLGLGFRFRVWGLGFRAWGVSFRVSRLAKNLCWQWRGPGGRHGSTVVSILYIGGQNIRV